MKLEDNDGLSMLCCIWSLLTLCCNLSVYLLMNSELLTAPVTSVWLFDYVTTTDLMRN